MLMWCQFALNIRFVTFWDWNQLWTSPCKFDMQLHTVMLCCTGIVAFHDFQTVHQTCPTNLDFPLNRGSVSKNNLKSKLTNIPFKFQKCILILTCIQKDVDRLVLAVLLWNDADISLSRTIPEQHLLQHAGTAKQTPQSQSLPSPG